MVLTSLQQLIGSDSSTVGYTKQQDWDEEVTDGGAMNQYTPDGSSFLNHNSYKAVDQNGQNMAYDYNY